MTAGTPCMSGPAMAAGRSRVATALAVGIVGGTVLGLVESLRTFDTNVHIEPGRYAAVYFGVPMMLTTMSVMLVMLVVGVLDGIVRKGRERDPVRLATDYGAILGLVTVGSATGYWAREMLSALRDTGSVDTWLVAAALVAVLPAGVAVAAGAGVAFGALWRRLGTAGRRRALVGLAVAVHIAFIPGLIVHWVTEARGFVYQGRRGTPRSPGDRNVLLITVDTLRADRVGVYGSGSASASLTPAIDAVAREGVLFEEAISSSPWTLPALASVMTGENPSRHGAGWPTGDRDLLARSSLRPGATLARVMQGHGYLTEAIVTNPYLSMHFGLEQGFDGYEQLTLEKEIFDVLGATVVIRASRAAFPGFIPDARASSVTDRAIGWLGRHRAEKFLLWVHYIDPHAPYVDPQAGAGTSFRGDTLLHSRGGQPVNGDVGLIDIARLRAGEVHLSVDERAELVRLYEAEVRYVDRQVGRLLGEFERLGLADDTIVVVLSDHGEEFWDHGGIEHGHTLYDELVRVPLVLRGPALPQGARVSGLVRLIDVAPTLLDLLGLPALQGVQGTSLLSRLRGERAEPLVAVSESLLFADDATGVRTDELKYIRRADGREEVYDLRTDALERHDLAGCSDLGPARAAYAGAVGWAGDGAPAVDGSRTALPAQVRAALRSLGYAH